MSFFISFSLKHTFKIISVTYTLLEQYTECILYFILTGD